MGIWCTTLMVVVLRVFRRHNPKQGNKVSKLAGLQCGFKQEDYSAEYYKYQVVAGKLLLGTVSLIGNISDYSAESCQPLTVLLLQPFPCPVHNTVDIPKASFPSGICFMTSGGAFLLGSLYFLKYGRLTIVVLYILLNISIGISEAITDKTTHYLYPQYRDGIYAENDDKQGQTRHPQR